MDMIKRDFPSENEAMPTVAGPVGTSLSLHGKMVMLAEQSHAD